MIKWLKRKIPSRQSFYAIYSTVYSLMMIAILLFAVFSQNSVVVKSLFIVTVLVMAIFLPVQKSKTKNKETKKTKSHHRKVVNDHEKQKRKRSRPKGTSGSNPSRQKQNARKIEKLANAHKAKSTNEEVIDKKSNEIKKGLSVSIEERIGSRNPQESRKNGVKSRNNNERQNLAYAGSLRMNHQLHSNDGVVLPNEIVSNDTNIAGHITDGPAKTLEAKAPDHIDEYLKSLRSRVLERKERVVNITHIKGEALNTERFLNTDGFDSVNKEPITLKLNYLFSQEGVARFADELGEMRWVRLPEGIDIDLFSTGQKLSVHTIKEGSKFRALSVSAMN
ncbi:hypothetical protein POF51_25865 [Brevibacillus sp. AG]|uniref:hypothetical protein n=1 Tax=Brevibacillus sp. AG TaxID=3020891 RepID=UPI00232F9482|nr:hypothetical protein [Brevibacillus sp. AG]MDC0764150.1 hypothetical protein [Brevibacillus sp. AG]